MKVEQVMVFPETAKAWLATQVANRGIHPSRLKLYEEDIKAGRWTESHQGIAFDKEGHLIDGQHRLMAIVRTGIPIVLTVAYGVDKSSVIDRGTPRKAQEDLICRGKITPEMASPKVVSVANQYIRSSTNFRSIPDGVLADFLIENFELVKTAIRISNTGANENICNRAPVQAAIFGALRDGVPEETLFRFTKCVNTGFMQGGPDESAAIVFRKYILEMKETGRTGGRANGDAIMKTAEMAIEDFSNKKRRTKKYQEVHHVYVRHSDGALV